MSDELSAAAVAFTDRVAQVFDDDGPLAAKLAGFEPRAGQRQLAQAVARTFETGGTLVAEAGTGTGKTLAYLVPAVLAGRRVLISTGTRTLQDQIFYKDIPALAAALGEPIAAAYMKGRTNYLCLHRFDRLHEAGAALPAEDGRWIERIADWLPHTSTGDRAELEDLPDSLPLWSELSATSEQCLGRECPRYDPCFVTRMRERAANARVVIVNHHLLCADASVRQGGGEVIPESELLVIDEAHQLEDVVTNYFGVTVSTFRFDELVHDGTRALSTIPAEEGRRAVALRGALDDVAHAGRRLCDLARLELRDGDGGDRLKVTAPVANRLSQAAGEARRTLLDLDRLIRHAPEASADLAGIAGRALELAAAIETVIATDDARHVRFLEARGRAVFLRAAPIDVADLVRSAIVGARHATVFTSATLAVDGSFAYILGRLGVADAATLRLASEFDFGEQAILYLPQEMPDPRSPEFNAAAAWAVAELLDRTRGRAFVLFTSYAAMREVHERLRRRVDWPLLVQGDAPRSALLRDFRNTPHAVLLATSSFWQGVDVAGDALSCVIVDRLPFASPGDPLVSARIDAVTSRGGNAFQDYQVPMAALTLLQGLGRLIRTRTDRGVLAVLDPRLTRMRYGQRFLATLPPAPMTDDLAVVARFFTGVK